MVLCNMPRARIAELPVLEWHLAVATPSMNMFVSDV
jgi:hypothetical protein